MVVLLCLRTSEHEASGLWVNMGDCAWNRGSNVIINTGALKAEESVISKGLGKDALRSRTLFNIYFDFLLKMGERERERVKLGYKKVEKTT